MGLINGPVVASISVREWAIRLSLLGPQKHKQQAPD
jgi:hypothetical protein